MNLCEGFKQITMEVAVYSYFLLKLVNVNTMFFYFVSLFQIVSWREAQCTHEPSSSQSYNHQVKHQSSVFLSTSDIIVEQAYSVLMAHKAYIDKIQFDLHSVIIIALLLRITLYCDLLPLA